MSEQRKGETPWVKGVVVTWWVVNAAVLAFLFGWLARDQGVAQWTIIGPVLAFQILALVAVWLPVGKKRVSVQ